MKLKRITKLNIDDLATLIPEDKYDVLDSYRDIYSEAIMYVAFEDDGVTVIGNALYLLYTLEVSSTSCYYLNVKEEYKGQGLEKELLTESMMDMKKRGHKNGLVLWDPDSDEENIPKECGMTELWKSVYVGYTIGQLREMGVSQRMAENGMFKNVKSYSELSEKTRRTFKKDTLSDSYIIKEENWDQENSRFYVVNNEVMAYITVNVRDDEVLSVVSYAIKDDESTKMAFALMIFSLVNIAISKLDDEAGFVAEFYDEKLLDAMVKAFGEPEGVLRNSYWGFK